MPTPFLEQYYYFSDIPELLDSFESFEREHLSSSWTLGEFDQRLTKKSKMEEDQTAYLEREIRRAREERIRARAPPMSRAELLHMLDTMNYNDEESLAKLEAAMYCRASPRIPVGEDGYRNSFRIVQNPDALLPDQPPQDNSEHVTENILGVNLSVQPATPSYPRVVDMSYKGTLVNESDDSNNGGFIFHQIGEVEVWCGENKNIQTLHEEGEGPWM